MICLDCGMTFDEAEIVVTCSHPEVEGCVSEYGQVCPCCKSDSVDESDICERCEEERSAGEIYMGLCEKCQTELKEKFIVLLKFNFKQNEIDFLFDIVGEL